MDKKEDKNKNIVNNTVVRGFVYSLGRTCRIHRHKYVHSMCSADRSIHHNFNNSIMFSVQESP